MRVIQSLSGSTPDFKNEREKKNFCLASAIEI